MSQEIGVYHRGFLENKIGSRIVSLAKSVKSKGVELSLNGGKLTGTHVAELSSGDFVLPEEDAQLFINRVIELGGYADNANVKSILSFLGETSDEQEAVDLLHSGTMMNGTPAAEPHTKINGEATETPSAEPVIRVDDYTFRLGERTFDLKSKQVRAAVVSYIRAACGGRTIGQLMQEAQLQRANSWLSGVEKGVSRITTDELQKIADTTKVQLSALLTGLGLSPITMHARSRKDTAENILKMPAFSEREIADFFKSRVLNRSVEPAEGVAIGQLMELAINPAEVDWQVAWTTLTKHGQDCQSFIDKEIERFGKMGDPLKILALRAIVQHYWPDMNK